MFVFAIWQYLLLAVSLSVVLSIVQGWNEAKISCHLTYGAIDVSPFINDGQLDLNYGYIGAIQAAMKTQTIHNLT